MRTLRQAFERDKKRFTQEDMRKVVDTVLETNVSGEVDRIQKEARLEQLRKDLNAFVEAEKRVSPNYFQKSLVTDLSKSYNVTLGLRKSGNHYYLEGYASDDTEDRDGDAMSPTALKGMAEKINSGDLNLFADHEHGWKNTLGVFTKSEVQSGRLWVQARLEDPNKNPDVSSLLNKLETGLKLGFSIGGDMNGSHRETRNGKSVRVIDGVKLYEVSVVGLPANANAIITGTKRF